VVMMASEGVATVLLLPCIGTQRDDMKSIATNFSV
jgi:hypothetical protein